MEYKSRSFYLVLIFFIGFAALIYEIYSVKVLFLFFVKHTQAVSIAISSFIAGLAVSSLIFSQMSKKKTKNIQLILLMQLAAAAYGFFVLTNYALIPQFLDIFNAYFESEAVVNLLKIMVMWIYLFIPAFFIGGAFPLINGLYLSKAEVASEETGIVYFWDMMGAITGAMVAGFLLIPYTGLYITVIVPIVINLLIALAVCYSRKLDYVLIAVIALIIGHTYFFQPSGGSHFHIPTSGEEKTVSTGEAELHQRFGRVSFQKESPFGTITVGSGGGQKTLFVNFRVMCTSFDVHNHLERALGQVTASNLPKGAKVANIGLGCGMTANEVAFHENVSTLDVIEINPVVLEAARQEFAEYTNDVTNADNVTMIIKDGAEYMRTTDKKYNAVLIDIEEVSVIYSSPLFTKEYYEIIKQRLEPGGVLSHWSFNPNTTFAKIMYNTLRAVFPHVEMQVSENKDINFYASDQPLNVPKPTAKEQEIIDSIFADPHTEVNTLEQPVLEKYFNINSIFALPDDFEEEHVR